MSSRFELEIPPTLTDAEARIVMEVLEEMIDCLCRRLRDLDRHHRPPDPAWETPPDWPACDDPPDEGS